MWTGVYCDVRISIDTITSFVTSAPPSELIEEMMIASTNSFATAAIEKSSITEAFTGGTTIEGGCAAISGKVGGGEANDRRYKQEPNEQCTDSIDGETFKGTAKTEPVVWGRLPFTHTHTRKLNDIPSLNLNDGS